MDKVGKMLVPMPFSGTLKDFKEQQHLHKGYEWITAISNPNVYFSLFQRWPQHNLPTEYNLHIVSFHLEAVDLKWLEEQSKRVTGEIIVLFDGLSNNYTIPRVRFLPYFYWHIQLQQIFDWYPQEPQKNITHKASTICNRIQTNKLLVFTALAEYLGVDDCMLVLRDWLEKENVYKFEETNNNKLNDLYDIFFKKYYGKEYTIDKFNEDDNYQKYTSDPNQLYLQNCAIHFTNESFSTSALYFLESPYNNALKLYPGPFITEKTLKCIAGCTAFIPVGQYNTYGILTELGFEFDYGFDCSFDSIKHDGDRLNAIVNLIETFKDIDSNTLYQMTKESTEKNYYYVKGGVFYNEIEKLNSYTAEQVIEHIKQTA